VTVAWQCKDWKGNARQRQGDVAHFCTNWGSRRTT
jgi:hypothetical protein